MQVQGAVAGNHHALAGRDLVGAHQSLRCARRHHAGQSPVIKGYRAFVGAGGQDQLTGLEQCGGAGHHSNHFAGRVGAPNGGFLKDLHTLGQGAAGQLQTRGKLRVHGPGALVRRRKRLEVLAAALGPLVQHHHAGAGPGGSDSSAQAGRAGADHQHIHSHLLRAGALRHSAKRGERVGGGA